MKKFIPILILLSLPMLLWSAGQEITVSNAREFLDALGSNRTIICKQGEYDLSAHTEMSGPQNYFRDAYDGAELVLDEIENLTIRGAGSNLTHFITRPSYGNVFALVGCHNIKFESLKAGHGPEKGYCTGGVVNLSDCSNIQITNCLLYGSGIEGLTAESSNDITLTNTVIEGCTYSIFSLDHCNSVHFEGCKFFDNEQFEMINLYECNDIYLKGCKFRNNRALDTYVAQKFLNVNNSTAVVLKKCTLEKNSAAYFCREEMDVEMKKCKMIDNKWSKRLYEDEL